MPVTKMPLPPGKPPPAVTSMDHMIPTRNQPALLGYYYAIFGLLPVVGLALSPVAICYGIIGLDRGNRLPRNIGYGHSLFAVVAGIIGAIISYGCAVALGVMLLMNYMSATWPFPPERDPVEELHHRVDALEQQARPGRNNPDRNLN